MPVKQPVVMALQRASCILLILALLTTMATSASVVGRRRTVTSCLADASVPFDIKNTTIWTEDATAYNLRLQYTPAAVAVPTSVAHIQAAVSCALQSGLRVSAKAGGHSYASAGFGGEDGHLVIALDRMFGVKLVDGDKAVIQPGARLGHVVVELYSQGKRALSHGSCE